VQIFTYLDVRKLMGAQNSTIARLYD